MSEEITTHRRDLKPGQVLWKDNYEYTLTSDYVPFFDGYTVIRRRYILDDCEPSEELIEIVTTSFLIGASLQDGCNGCIIINWARGISS